MGLVAEFLIHTRLDDGIVRTKTAFTFLAVAVLATDHRIRQRINIHARLGGVACEFLVHALLDGGLVRPEAALALITVAVLATNHSVSERVDVH